MRIVVGSDHAGWPMKGSIIQYIQGRGHQVVDVGCYDERPVDFPDMARSLTSVIKDGDAERGVMVCGTGVGACIAANKVSGIRAAVCHDVHSAHQCVEHDDVNVICIGAQIVGPWLANDLIAAYLEARFSGDADFVRRVEKLGRMDGSVA